jgi:hypothetical protein
MGAIAVTDFRVLSQVYCAAGTVVSCKCSLSACARDHVLGICWRQGAAMHAHMHISSMSVRHAVASGTGTGATCRHVDRNAVSSCLVVKLFDWCARVVMAAAGTRGSVCTD